MSPASALVAGVVSTAHTDGHGLLSGRAGLILTNHMISPAVGFDQIGWTMFIAGAGVRMAMVPVTSAVLGSVPDRQAGMESSITNTFRELGTVVGVAVLGSIATASSRSTFSDGW